MLRLGSNSTTRAKILKESKIEFIQEAGEFNEQEVQAREPKAFAYEATKGKFNELYKKYGVQKMPLLVADTVVTCSAKLLRKATSKEEARKMLELQSNNRATIITCMIYKSKNIELIDISATTYFFKEFNKEHMQQYLDSGEYMGKAGAIMVEGFCKPYIKKVIGYESTAMGLCVERLKQVL